jgi:protein-tyrosine phosphatase
LLRFEIENGVKAVALTPHFRLNVESVSDFIERRKRAYESLSAAVTEAGLQIQLVPGAEVEFSPDLLDCDIEKLCYENTRMILIELPMLHYPPFARDVFYRLQIDGYIPVIAHAERYPYFEKKRGLLEELAHGGAIIQVNADSLLRYGKTRKRTLRLIKDGLVDVLASDAHSMGNRLPAMGKAIKFVTNKLGDETARRLVSFELQYLQKKDYYHG